MPAGCVVVAEQGSSLAKAGNPRPFKIGDEVVDPYGNRGIIEVVPHKGHRGASYWVLMDGGGRAFLLRSELRKAPRANPKRGWPSATEIQTLVFPATYTVASAKAWAKQHGFKAGKVDVTDSTGTVRVRSEERRVGKESRSRW